MNEEKWFLVYYNDSVFTVLGPDFSRFEIPLEATTKEEAIAEAKKRFSDQIAEGYRYFQYVKQMDRWSQDAAYVEPPSIIQKIALFSE